MLILLIIVSMPFTFPNRKARSSPRSYELKKLVTKEGNVERIEFYSDGKLAFAGDKGYATLTRTRTDNTVLVEYFDENGVPTKQKGGYYAILIEYSDAELKNAAKQTYLDLDHRPVMLTSGFSVIVRSFDEEGRVEYEHYLDADGKPVMQTNGSCGRYFGYENGENTLVVYLNNKDEPTLLSSGYAMIKRSFYHDRPETDLVEYEFYFDENEMPVALSAGHCGVRYEYDEYGRTNCITYLDANGEPTVTKQGYTIVRKTFYPNNTVETQMYYGIDGEPIALANGEYGVKVEPDGSKVFLNAYGKEMFNLKRFLNNSTVIVVLCAAATICLSILLPRKANYALLLLYGMFIIYMALLFRSDRGTREIHHLFRSYSKFFTSTELRKEILHNIWLFVPFGVIVHRLWPKAVYLLIPLALSVLIEFAQYAFALGCVEIDDVVSNTLGGAIGFGIGCLAKPIMNKLKRFIDNRKSAACSS